MIHDDTMESNVTITPEDGDPRPYDHECARLMWLRHETDDHQVTHELRMESKAKVSDDYIDAGSIGVLGPEDWPKSHLMRRMEIKALQALGLMDNRDNKSPTEVKLPNVTVNPQIDSEDSQAFLDPIAQNDDQGAKDEDHRLNVTSHEDPSSDVSGKTSLSGIVDETPSDVVDETSAPIDASNETLTSDETAVNPIGWYVQKQDSAFKFAPRNEWAIDGEDGAAASYDLKPTDEIPGDQFLPRHAYRYLSPDKSKIVMVMIEGAVGLLDPFVDASDELGYGLSYEDAYLTLIELGVNADTIYDVEAVVNSIPEDVICRLMDDVEDEIQVYEKRLRRKALADVIQESRWYRESRDLDDVADPKWENRQIRGDHQER